MCADAAGSAADVTSSREQQQQQQQSALHSLKSLTASSFAYPSLPGFANAFGATAAHPWAAATAAAFGLNKYSSAINGYMQRMAGACVPEQLTLWWVLLL